MWQNLTIVLLIMMLVALTLYTVDAERGRKKRERAEVLRDIVGWHGCLTGDCPHDNQRECDSALADEYRVLAREVRSS